MNPTLAILIGAFLFVFIVFGLVMKCRQCRSGGDSGYIPGVTDGTIAPGDHHHHAHGHHGDGGSHSGGHSDGGGHGGFSDGGGGAHSAH
jgi:uncharacterized membrane protein YgcG